LDGPLADRVAAACIAIGGVGTIWQSPPFFVLPESRFRCLRPVTRSLCAIPGAGADWVKHLGVDEYRVMVGLSADGTVRGFRLDTGEVFASRPIVPADSIAATAYDLASGTLALGRRDDPCSPASTS
jgi:hypothetical protein